MRNDKHFFYKHFHWYLRIVAVAVSIRSSNRFLWGLLGSIYSPFRENAHWRLISRPFPVHAARKNTERKGKQNEPFETFLRASAWFWNERARKKVSSFQFTRRFERKNKPKTLCQNFVLDNFFGDYRSCSVWFKCSSLIATVHPANRPLLLPTHYSADATLTLGKTTIFFPIILN